MQSDDPDFESKAADVIGLYINRPDHAAVFAVDEKAASRTLTSASAHYSAARVAVPKRERHDSTVGKRGRPPKGSHPYGLRSTRCPFLAL